MIPVSWEGNCRTLFQTDVSSVNWVFQLIKCFNWFGLGNSLLEVSSSKSLASEGKGFAFWVELVALGFSSAGPYVVCELLHRSGVFTLCAPKG